MKGRCYFYCHCHHPRACSFSNTMMADIKKTQQFIGEREAGEGERKKERERKMLSVIF